MSVGQLLCSSELQYHHSLPHILPRAVCELQARQRLDNRTTFILSFPRKRRMCSIAATEASAKWVKNPAQGLDDFGDDSEAQLT